MLFQILGVSPTEALEKIYTFTKPEFKQRIYFAAQSSLAEFAGTHMTTIEECIEYVLTTRRRIDDKKEIVLEKIIPDIHKDLFANINSVDMKITHLAMYCAKMFEYMIGERTLDDRDSWANKQLVTAGFQISKLFSNKTLSQVLLP
jgi:DNA-directed RNA polymerase beta subunit